jgi:hypothetical protein
MIINNISGVRKILASEFVSVIFAQFDPKINFYRSRMLN